MRLAGLAKVRLRARLESLVEARSEPIRSYFYDAVIDPASGTVWISAVWTWVRVDAGLRP